MFLSDVWWTSVLLIKAANQSFMFGFTHICWSDNRCWHDMMQNYYKWRFHLNSFLHGPHFLKPYIEIPFVFLLSLNQNKAWSQLRISGLFPSAYWFGQALVDVPMYWLIFLFMYLMDYILSIQNSLLRSIIQILQVSDSIHRTNIIVRFN